MHSDTVTEAAGGETAPIYPGLPRRIKASAIDVLVIVLLTISLPVLTNRMYGEYSSLNMVALFGPLLLLEPLLVSFFGATVGQMCFGMRVVYVKTMGRCPFLVAYFRYVLKVLLGGVSLAYMFFSQRQQAIHDHAAGTVVVLKAGLGAYRSAAGPAPLPVQADDAAFIYPSILRRFAVFLGWYALVLVLSAGAFAAAASVFAPACLKDKVPSEASTLCTTSSAIADLGLMGCFFYLAYLGGTGRLPGAKRMGKELDKPPGISSRV